MILISVLIFLIWYILYGWDGLKRDMRRFGAFAHSKFRRKESLDTPCREQ